MLRGQAKAQCLQACLIPHAPKSTERNLHLARSGLFCTNPAPVLTQAFSPSPSPLELFYARLQQEELSEEPTQPSLHQGCHRGRRWPAVLRGPRNQTRSQPHTGRKEAEPLPREMRASGTSLSDRSRSGPLPAPALPGEPHCCCTVLMLPTPKAGSSFQHYSNLSETRLQTTGCFRQARS